MLDKTRLGTEVPQIGREELKNERNVTVMNTIQYVRLTNNI